MTDVLIERHLAELGLTGANAALAREALEQAGLTRPGKQRIAVSKLADVRKVIDARYALLCGPCAARRKGAETRTILEVPPAACTLCGGSANQRALREMTERCERLGVRRILLVGGAPALREEFARLGSELELRLVDGTARRTRAEARSDVTWADVICVSSTSELSHQLANRYTGDEHAKGKIVTASRRGIEAIADAISQHLDLRRRGPSRLVL